ncbi:Protein kinase domain containing protein [Coccidioides posadasii C735 delta SOWgp]|uniref:non-specific serine/threonine protein kinase n=1 Tax=Coccidioides posadasii (strain C735) TaxID=222929 RepID=C5P1Y0_COCP7|nr:Protein kinase domain containing protein [Coccidioides posadasii C735 delta SOWgp]EER28883.1 Protein kinase domain containing protein [Coccidioides posadasii C735 delta SOWgp]|eukprot:XP_003071028.1 Protein kinase domain containing protein [Coccidioides posadasii C735 delta SOWgp]
MAIVEKFFYDGDDGEVEDMRKYKRGGYHPVLLGEVLPKQSTSNSRKPRYWILQKLGHGAFATVWLAKDLLGSLGYVALKINISCITGENNEIRILRQLRDSGHQNQLGYNNVIHLLDDFAIQGPNGIHDCIVTEVVGGMRYFRDTSIFKACVKKLSLQAIMGLSYLHSQGNESVPAYLVPSVSLVEFLEWKAGNSATYEPLCLKIMDLGNSFRKSDKRPPSNTPIAIRAPEVTFCELSNGKVGSDWDKPIDVWAAACTLALSHLPGGHTGTWIRFAQTLANDDSLIRKGSGPSSGFIGLAHPLSGIQTN